MEPDYDSMDPEERTNKYLAIISAALGLISILAALLPICGAITGVIGVVIGYFGMKSESRRTAILGIVLSTLGILTSLVYMVLVSLKK
ncbi:MAG: hypothetical protein C3F13_09655 [Anaerolineales bacterium]|nr:hypothetical protein [Anaerolineae bacterium]PWB53228.1 MAG: hypothetical protein C3F13_09655 [Anaerolineales bacterium]